MKVRTAIALLSFLLIVSCKKKEDGPVWHWSEGDMNFNISTKLTTWAKWGDTLEVVTFVDAADINHQLRLAFKAKPDRAKQYKVVANPKADDEIAVFMSYYDVDWNQYIDVNIEAGHLRFSSEHFKTSHYNYFGSPNLSWTSHFEGPLELSDATE